jgi:hypothetical protein
MIADLYRVLYSGSHGAVEAISGGGGSGGAVSHSRGVRVRD